AHADGIFASRCFSYVLSPGTGFAYRSLRCPRGFAGIDNKPNRKNKMDTRRMGVVLLLAMFVIIGAALSGCSSNPSKQDIGTVSGAVVGGIVGSALTGGSTVGTVAGAGAGAYAGNRIGRQLDRR
ncbi:MAG TPA: glycine zipper domain-containing protein, partial [Rhodocyclaceae bacterium]|nr:glycine zipper domain-containing protein [Rhodocyclaceae bacterium]